MLRLGEWGINLKLKKKKNSIILNTLIKIIAFSAIILVILWIFQIGFLNFFYEKYTVSNMDSIKRKIEKSSEEDLNVLLETIAYENNICIEQIVGDMQISYNTKIKACLLDRNNFQIAAFKRDMMTNPDLNKLELNDKVSNTKSLLYGIRRNNQYIFIFTTLEDINETSVVLKSQLIYITLIVMGLSFIIAYFISKKITSPVVNMTSSAKKLASGDYDVLFEKNGIEELDELADSLNYATHELSKTLELRRDLMANVSHDLKTPLTMIKAYAEMVKDYTYKDKTKREENLDIIIKETDRLNLLVNDILDLSKLQASKESLNIEEFDLIKEINGIIKRYDYLKSDGYELIYHGPNKEIIKADKIKITQVIYNLINNAVNYTGKDKKVYIEIEKIANKLKIMIRDTGKGIDLDEKKYIWDKYYKTNKLHQRNKVGTGIGLSIVKEILNYHNFEYGVDSKKGKGTTFYFYINL